MEEKERDIKKIDEIPSKSISDISIKQYLDESFTKTDIQWIPLHETNSVVAGNIISIILFSLGTAFIGAFLSIGSRNPVHLYFIVGLILMFLGTIAYVMLVHRQFEDWKKRRIPRGVEK